MYARFLAPAPSVLCMAALIQVLAHMLSPELPEAACIYVGKAIIGVVMRAGDALGGMTPQVRVASSLCRAGLILMLCWLHFHVVLDPDGRPKQA